MKPSTVILFCVVFFVINHVSSQTIKPIDSKSGFKDFKLGDNFNKWKNQLTYEKESGGLHFYNYTGICCKELFGKNIIEIRLGFEYGKLVVIAASFEILKYKSIDNKYLRFYEDDFIVAFGEPDHRDRGDDDKINLLEEWKYSWVGEQTTLELSTFYGSAFDGKMTANFLIFPSNESYAKRKLKEF